MVLGRVYGKLLSIVTFPGVILHEYSHKLVCEYLGIPVYDVKYFSLDFNVDGRVCSAPIYDFYESFAVCFAPFIVNTGAGILCAILGGIFGGVVGWLFQYLGFSFLVHSFPSYGDLNNTLRLRNDLTILEKLFFYPFLGLFYLVNALSTFWFDVIYAWIIVVEISTIFHHLF